jgi:ribonuclease VapC
VGQATSVLDASALIALIRGEPGADAVNELARGAVISTVNWVEVLAAIAALGLSIAGRRAQLERLGISLAPFTPEQAEAAASMHPATRDAGLSLADRACLALAFALGGTAVTADRAWAEVDVGVDVKLIR